MATMASREAMRRHPSRDVRRVRAGLALAAWLTLVPLGAVAADATPTPAPATGGHPDHAAPEAATPTAAERAAADRLLSRTAAALARFAEPDVAQAAGYLQLMPFWFGEIRAAHYLSAAAVADDRVLDPERPESLIYQRTADGRLVLLGAMFLAPIGAGPAVGGPLTEWHAHPELCGGFEGVVPVLASGRCQFNTGPIALEMTHVWLVPNRLGPFAHVLTPEDAAAATGQSVVQTRPLPLVADPDLRAAVGRTLGLTPDEIRHRFAAGESLAAMARANGVARWELLEAIEAVFADGLTQAVDVGELSAHLHPVLARYGIAQTDALLDVTADDLTPATEATEFGYPCLQVTCLAPVAAPAPHVGH